MEEQQVDLVSKNVVIGTWLFIILLAPLYFLRGGLLVSGLVFLLFPAGLFGNLRYISESAFKAANNSNFTVLGGWLTYFLILHIGLRFRSRLAYRRWLIVCLLIFLLTWAGCEPLTRDVSFGS